MKMKSLINVLFIFVLIDCCVCLRNVQHINRSISSIQNFDNLEQNQLVKQLIDELTKNLQNKTLVNKIRNLNSGMNDHQQLISNLTGNLDDRDPLMSQYLDRKLKIYLLKVQQQSFNQTIDLMEILKQFKDVVSIGDFNLTNEFELINTTTRSTINHEEFELIHTNNSTDLNSTKLSRMEFLTDTLISLLIGKLIGLKIGFFAGKLIRDVPFSLKKSCCQTNTWPSDMPGLEPTPPTSIIRNQFISMKDDKKPVLANVDKKLIAESNGENRKSKGKKKKNRPTVQNDDEYDEWENDEDWRVIDEDDRPSKRKSNKSKQMNRNKYANEAENFDRNFDEQIEDSLGDLDEMPADHFREYTNYHPIYSAKTLTSTPQSIYSNSKNSFLSTHHHFHTSTTHLPNIQTSPSISSSTGRKHYMLLTGK